MVYKQAKKTNKAESSSKDSNSNPLSSSNRVRGRKANRSD